MRVAICCICKNENDYILEFVEWYKNLGVDNVIIYDNNDVDGEKLKDVINDYIESGFVIIHNVKGEKVYQLPAYNRCIEEHGNEYDWIAFFDCDEYLTLVEHNNIKDYLSEFPDYCDSIHVNWMIMDDNDLLYNDGRKLMKRFTREVSVEKQWNNRMQMNENEHIKSILRTNKNLNQHFVNPHFAINCNYVMNASGLLCENSYRSTIDYNKAYLKHFNLKTITEFLNKKMQRGTPDITFEQFVMDNPPESFYRLNKQTPEKDAIIQEFYNSMKFNNQ